MTHEILLNIHINILHTLDYTLFENYAKITIILPIIIKICYRKSKFDTVFSFELYFFFFKLN